jgi:SET domain
VPLTASSRKHGQRIPDGLFELMVGMGRISFHIKNLAIRMLHRVCCLYPRDDGEPSENFTTPPGGVTGNDSPMISASLIPNAGRGCFADRDYQSGEVVCEYTGTVLTTIDVLRTKDWRYMMDLGRDHAGRRVWVDARVHLGVKARFINHHFDASKWNLNSQSVPAEKKCILTASQFIRKGEELYFDYGPRHWHCFDRMPAPRS